MIPPPPSESPNSQNPNFEFHPFFGFAANSSPSAAISASGAENAGDRVAGGIFSSPAAPRARNEKPNVSGRSKPRLVKLRRRTGSRTGILGSTPNNFDPGFSPFGQSSDPASDNIGMLSKSGNFRDNVKPVKFENAGLVFGANRIDLDLSLGSGKYDKRTGAGFRDRPNWRGVNSDSKKSDHAVFGGSKSDAVLTSNAKNRYLSGREGNFGPGDRLELNVEGEVGLGKFNEANVEAGASMSNSTLKSHSEQREFGGAMENCGLGDGTRVNFRSENFDKAGVQYSFNQHASASSLNLDNRNDAESIRYNIGFNNCADLRKLTANSRSGDRGSHSNRRDSASNYRSPVKVEDRKCDSRIFVFGSCQSDSISSLKQEKKKSCRNAEKLICKNRGKKIGINGKFGTDQSEGLPNLFKLKRDCGESSSSLVSDDKENMKVQTELDSQSVSTSSAWSKPVQTGSHQLDKSYGKGFASGGSHSYTKNEVLKKSEKFGNKDDDSITKSNMGLDANGGCNLEFGISKSSKNTPHGINPVSELSDEVKKLHIHGIFNANSTDRNKNYSSSCVQADGIFVFRSRGSSDSLKGSSVSVKQNKNSGVEGPVEDFVDGKSDSGEFHVHTGSGFSEILGQEGLPVHNEKSVKSQTFGTSPEITFHAAVAKSCNANDVTKSNGASGPSSLLSVSPEFQPNDSVSEASALSRSERESRFSFFSSQDNLGVSSVTFQTPRSGALYTSEVNFFQRSSGKLAFSAKSRSIKDRKLRKEIGKLGKPTYSKMNSVKVMRPDESRFLGSPNSSECYSPMDFSPYQNPVTDSQCSTGNFATPSKPCNLDSNLVHAAKPSISADVRDVDLITKRECFAMGEGDKKGQEPSEESSQYNWEKQFFQPETSCHKAGNEEGCFGVGIASAEAGVGIHSSAMRPESTCKGQFFFASCSQDSKEKSFTFSALPSTQCHSSAAKHRYRKKNRLKSYQFSAPASNASPLNTVECQIEEPSKEGKIKSEAREVQVKQLACEKWRFRGNQAYRHRKFSRAEDYYTKGINSVPPGETSGCCLDPLVLCYSNRAAARMSLGRTREALGDCRIAVALDPHFLKAQIRAANCHLVLGEVDEALQYFRKCHESSGGVCLDRRILIDAFDGMQKAQKVDESTRQIADLLQEKTCDAAAVALDVIAEALSISANSEKLLEMKAEALYMLRKYGEVICLCKQTVEFAEKNFYSLSIKDSVASIESSGSKSSLYSNLWRTHLISKCYFNMGKLDMALDLLEKQEQAGSNIENSWNKNWDSPTQLAGTIRELLCHKNAGNESFQAGRYTEAIEHYTTALTMNVESHPFAAILFCNRAAAHQALAQLADAISDCSLAMALDETYQKAISRRASLHEKIRDYGQAANDLRRLISVREKKSSESSGGPSSSGKENRQAHKHLSTMEEADKKGLPLDFYLILGVKHSDTASEIKKAYRKAALRHHPDKAGQLLTRNGSGDDGQMRIKIIEDVHRDADRLFKMIGEAYAVLSDPVKRSQYDHEEKIRNAPKESNNMYTRSSDTYGYPYQSGKDRHYWQGTYRTYGNSHSRW